METLEINEEEQNEINKIQKKPLIEGPLIHPWKGGRGLAEIYQSMNLKISLLKKRKDSKRKSGVFDEVTPGVLCRDFLADVYTSAVQKYKFSIYGMSWDGTKNQPDWEAVYLKLVFPNDNAKQDFKKNIKFLHEIEKNNHIPLTKFYDKMGKIGMVVGDKSWLLNALRASLYTFLIRSFCYSIKTNDWIKELGKKDYTDSRYISSINRDTWNRILKDIKSIDTDLYCGLDHKKDGMGAIHHNSGFVSVFGKHSEMNPSVVKKNRHWQEMGKRGFKLYTK
jgi:hypothetical protein